MSVSPSASPFSRPITPALHAVSGGLLLVFLVSQLSQLPALRLLDPIWQLRFAASMAENGLLPLMALGLLFLAAHLEPENPRAIRLRNTASRLALLAALGYLLLLPLQVSAIVEGRASLQLRYEWQRKQIEKRAQALEQAIRSASSTGELNSQLTRLQAPILSASEQELPISELRPTLLSRLQQGSRLAAQNITQSAPLSLARALLTTLRTSLSNGVYALMFAACSYGPRSRVSRLQQLIHLLTHGHTMLADRWQRLGRRLTSFIRQREIQQAKVAHARARRRAQRLQQPLRKWLANFRRRQQLRRWRDQMRRRR